MLNHVTKNMKQAFFVDVTCVYQMSRMQVKHSPGAALWNSIVLLLCAQAPRLKKCLHFSGFLHLQQHFF